MPIYRYVLIDRLTRNDQPLRGIFMHVQVQISVMHEENTHNTSWLMKLDIKKPRGTVGHQQGPVDAYLEKQIGGEFLFEQASNGHINKVFFNHDETPDAQTFKKGECCV